MKDSRGFTLIELLVAIAIIAVLSTMVLGALGAAHARARDAERKSDLHEMQAALHEYYVDHGSFPVAASWSGASANGGGKGRTGAQGYIPGLAPDYIPTLPTDPSGETSGWSGYNYVSDGVNYKIIDNATGPESFPAAGTPFYDPLRPTWAWMVCSGEPACSSW